MYVVLISTGLPALLVEKFAFSFTLTLQMYSGLVPSSKARPSPSSILPNHHSCVPSHSVIFFEG
jgi:hypothetical protein